MSSKQVLFRAAAREQVLRGATQLADAVRLTLGPKSKSVLIQKKWGAPIVCNDGVTIARGDGAREHGFRCEGAAPDRSPMTEKPEKVPRPEMAGAEM